MIEIPRKTKQLYSVLYHITVRTQARYNSLYAACFCPRNTEKYIGISVGLQNCMLTVSITGSSGKTKQKYWYRYIWASCTPHIHTKKVFTQSRFHCVLAKNATNTDWTHKAYMSLEVQLNGDRWRWRRTNSAPFLVPQPRSTTHAPQPVLRLCARFLLGIPVAFVAPVHICKFFKPGPPLAQIVVVLVPVRGHRLE